MEFKDPKKDILWFCKTELNKKNKQDKPEPEEKVRN